MCTERLTPLPIPILTISIPIPIPVPILIPIQTIPNTYDIGRTWLPFQGPALANFCHKTSQLHLGQTSSYNELEPVKKSRTGWVDKSCKRATNQSIPPMQPRGPWQSSSLFIRPTLQSLWTNAYHIISYHIIIYHIILYQRLHRQH